MNSGICNGHAKAASREVWDERQWRLTLTRHGSRNRCTSAEAEAARTGALSVCAPDRCTGLVENVALLLNHDGADAAVLEERHYLVLREVGQAERADESFVNQLLRRGGADDRGGLSAAAGEGRRRCVHTSTCATATGRAGIGS